LADQYIDRLLQLDPHHREAQNLKILITDKGKAQARVGFCFAVLALTVGFLFYDKIRRRS
jgi:hypothetical protein